MGATLTVDPKKYSRLANRVVVKAIETEEEYDRMVAAVEQLIDKGEDHLSPEESALLETLAILVQAYDDRYHPLPSVAPNEMLAYLMGTSGRTAKDLLPVLGTRGRVSEVLNGRLLGRPSRFERFGESPPAFRCHAAFSLCLTPAAW